MQILENKLVLTFLAVGVSVMYGCIVYAVLGTVKIIKDKKKYPINNPQKLRRLEIRR